APRYQGSGSGWLFRLLTILAIVPDRAGEKLFLNGETRLHEAATRTGWREASVLPFTRIVAPPLVQELRTRDDRFDQAAERILVGRQPGPHFVKRFFIRRQQAATEGVRE